MTTLKTPEEILESYAWKKGWSEDDVEFVITQDRQATAQVLCDLVEGEKGEEIPIEKHAFCLPHEHCYDCERNVEIRSKNATIEKAQALIRQTLDPISNQE